MLSAYTTDTLIAQDRGAKSCNRSIQAFARAYGQEPEDVVARLSVAVVEQRVDILPQPDQAGRLEIEAVHS